VLFLKQQISSKNRELAPLGATCSSIFVMVLLLMHVDNQVQHRFNNKSDGNLCISHKKCAQYF
jgi:hypothetical protein